MPRTRRTSRSPHRSRAGAPAAAVVPGGLLALVALAAAGCGTTPPDVPDAAPEATSGPTRAVEEPTAGGSPDASVDVPVVTIDDFAYVVPATVAPGATVRVDNVDVETHTMTSTPAGGFAVSVPVDGSGTFVAPAASGTYAFVCLLHGGMSGELVVG